MTAFPHGAGARTAKPSIHLPVPCLMLITDRSLAGGTDALVAAVEAAIEGGVDTVQLREKDLPPVEMLPLAKRLRQVTSGRALFLVNGALEVALASAADGVHLPEDASMVEWPFDRAQDRPARPFLVGRSVHSREAAGVAWAECSDYLIAGPVFETASHPGAAPAGLSLIESIVDAVAVPVLAVGGITAERVEDVLRAGASGVAVISAILGAGSARDAAVELREALDTAWAAAGRAH